MKTKPIISSVVLLGILAACESFVTGIDEDDITQPQDAELKLVVTAGQLAYMGTLEGDMARICGLWSGYFYGIDRQAGNYYNYGMVSSISTGLWNNVYASALKNLRIAQEKASLLNNRSTLGMCQAMEASLMGTAAALWGDIPFSEAVNVELYPDPKYEPQLEVIDKIIVLADSAIINLQMGVGNSRDGDFLYGIASPDAMWISVCHSVKARLLLYKKDYPNALVAANSGIQSPASDLLSRHGVGPGERNLYYEYLVNSAWTETITASNTWLGQRLNSGEPGNRNHAKTNEGARLNKYYSGTSVSTYVPNTSSAGFFSSTARFPLHTAFETKLIAAECLIRMGDFGNALTILNEHRANLRAEYPKGTYINFIAADFDAGGIENQSAGNTREEALLAEILEEKHVCLFAQVEAFNEIRRTGNAISLPPNTGAEHPQRFLYAQTEINSNSSTPNPIPGLFEKTAIFK